MSWIGAKIYKIRSRIREAKIKYRFKRKVIKYAPIIVYQMGKVASTSIYLSLKKSYPGITLHRHVLNEPGDWEAEKLLENVSKRNKPVKLISLVREPLSRNVSAFFQNFEKITGIKPNESKFSITELKNYFLTSPKTDNMTPLKWFDENILKNFGIDVFAEPFPKEQGWKKYRKKNIELLLIKSEISDEIKTGLLREFTGLNDFNLSAYNIGEDKDYAGLYSFFKQNIKFSGDYLNMFHNTPQVRHFYTDAEIEIAYNKWKIEN